MHSIKQLIKKSEVIVLSMLCVFRVIYFLCLRYTLTPDSYEYIARDGFAWLHGSLDRYRLPVYPMLIDVCKFISETRFPLLVCGIQLFAALLSILVLYWTLKKLIDKKWICLTVTFLYGTIDAVSGWDRTLLTESLSLSLTVFVVFGIVSFIKENKYKYVFLTAGCLLLGCFLRAVFVIYAGLFFGFLILISIFPAKNNDATARSRQRKMNMKCSLIAVIPVALVLVYAFLFNNQYGGFTLSDSALGQQLYIVIEKNYYKDASDKELINIVDSIVHSSANSTLERKIDVFFKGFYKENDTNADNIQQIKKQLLSTVDNRLDNELEELLDQLIYEEYQNDYDCSFTDPVYLARLYIMESYDRNRVNQFVTESKRNNIKSYIRHSAFNVFESYSSYHIFKGSGIPGLFTNMAKNALFFLSLTVFHSLIISVIELLSFAVLLIKHKRVDWIRLGLGVFILSTVLLSVLGTNAEFARAAITSLPFMFIAIAMYINCFFNRIVKQTKLCA